ncbi:MAG: DNA polymerase III subunit epsilon [Rhodanobacter sp.]
MRQIALDTETTGLEVRQGHRLIEIACVELVGRRVTGSEYHTFLNPGRAIDEGARKVTGIADEFLLDKPLFADVAEEFLAFIDGAELIIHNASFDLGFLDAELAKLQGGHGRVSERCSVIDTLKMAREQYPGQRNNLDALCKRLGVDNSRRDLHGGLIDAQLLADVYLMMTSGQGAFDLGFEGATEQRGAKQVVPTALLQRPRVRYADASECAAHNERLDALDKGAPAGSVWRRLDVAPGSPAAAPDNAPKS